MNVEINCGLCLVLLVFLVSKLRMSLTLLPDARTGFSVVWFIVVVYTLDYKLLDEADNFFLLDGEECRINCRIFLQC